MIRAMILAAGLTLAGAAAGQERPWTPLPDPLSATCPGGLCQPNALGTFFAAVERPGRIVRIVQFGDSHTAGGHIVDSLLWRLRGRFEGRDVRLTAHGRVGATLRDLADRQPLLDPADPSPDLVILAYGTNEGFDDLLDPVAYENLLMAQIDRVRAAAPGASILILGAPDAMRSEGGGRCPADPGARWKPPATLAVVRDVQHRVAARARVAFWDWRGRMGGDCSAHTLTLGDAPLMRADHVHFTAAGGDWIGGLLFADLVAAYQSRRGGR